MKTWEWRKRQMDESQGRQETKSGKLNELGKLSGSRAVKLNRLRHGGCNRSVSLQLWLRTPHKLSTGQKGLLSNWQCQFIGCWIHSIPYKYVICFVNKLILKLRSIMFKTVNRLFNQLLDLVSVWVNLASVFTVYHRALFLMERLFHSCNLCSFIRAP